jgi:hypothetical protein
MKIQVVSLLVIFGLLGCAAPANYRVQKYGQIEKTNKSITVPSLGSGMFEIKEALRSAGWRLKVDSTSIKETGTNNDRIDKETTLKFDTVYRMYMTSTMSTNENLGITTFNLTVVDNKTNEELVNIVGNREEYVRYDPFEIARHLVVALTALEKQ